jgi:DNA-binding transcriptional MerR regulator
MLNGKMTVGELAKIAHVTVRTLQYYDKIGLLKPSDMTEGGRRLYSEKDITILHQIITLKSLGLGLSDIKDRLIPIITNDDIKNMLLQQSMLIKEQISKSSKVLESIEMISDDIDKSGDVDWSKYSNMVKLIQDNNEHFWVMNYLDNDVLKSISAIHESFTEEELPSDWLVKSMEKTLNLINNGYRPDSPEAQEVAGDLWGMIEKYTNGQPELINKLYDFYKGAENWPERYYDMQVKSQAFLEASIECYMANRYKK